MPGDLRPLSGNELHQARLAAAMGHDIPRFTPARWIATLDALWARIETLERAALARALSPAPETAADPSFEELGASYVARLERQGASPDLVGAARKAVAECAASVKDEIAAAARLLDEHAKAHKITFIGAPAPRPEETRPGTRRDADGVEVHTNPPFGTADEPE